jgi:hypothetical protein
MTALVQPVSLHHGRRILAEYEADRLFSTKEWSALINGPLAAPELVLSMQTVYAIAPLQCWLACGLHG